MKSNYFSLIALLIVPCHTAGGQTAPQSPLEQRQELSASVALDFASKPLSDILSELSHHSKVKLSPSSDLAERRVSVFAPKGRASSVLQSFAFLFGATWQTAAEAQKTEAGFSGDYQIFLSLYGKKRQEQEIADSEQFEREQKAAEVDAMRRAINERLAEKNGDPLMRELLNSLSPEELEQTASLSSDAMGIISANDSRHMENHLFHATPLSQLSGSLQNRMSDLPKDAEFGTDGTEKPTRAAPPTGSGTSVGLLASDGSVNLAVVAPDGKTIWMSPLGALNRKPVAGLTDDDSHPEVMAVLQKGRLIEWGNMPVTMIRKRLRFPASLEREKFAAILKSLSEQTGMTVVSDDYLRSNKTPFSWLLTDKKEYTLEEALTQIGRAFGHRFLYRQGVLIARTATPGLDIRSEPPASLVAYLREKTKRKQGWRLSDILMFGRLKPIQLRTLTLRLPEGIMPLPSLDRIALPLRLYMLLSPEQKRSAEKKGVAETEMRGEAREIFRRLSGVGLPASKAQIQQVNDSGFFVRLPNQDTKSLTFFVAPPNGTVTRYSMSVMP